MRDTPTERQARVLRLIAEAGGYAPLVDDAAAADECIAQQWLMPDARSGYAITIEGAAAMRAAESGTEKLC